jgi:hypothetical protein
MSFAFEQDPQRFQDVALIIGDKNPAHRLTLNRESITLSMLQRSRQCASLHNLRNSGGSAAPPGDGKLMRRRRD